MRKRALATLAALATVVALTVALSAPASASQFHRSWVTYNGAASSEQFYTSGTEIVTMSSIRLAVQLPRGGYCVSSRMLIDGVVRIWGGTLCDSNGDGHIVWWLGTLSAYSGDVVTAWFSDPWTCYACVHPKIVLPWSS